MSCTHDCGCTPEIRDARTDEWVQIAPESARPATLTGEQPVKAPVPRRIEREDVRSGMVIETRTQWEAASSIIDGHFEAVESSAGEVRIGLRCEVWLIEDAPEPVDPDAAAIEAMVTAYRRSPECSTHAVFGEAMLDHLRAQGFDVTPRAEQ